MIRVLQKNENGWWMGIVRKETGWFPSNWIESVPNPSVRHQMKLTLGTSVYSNAEH